MHTDLDDFWREVALLTDSGALRRLSGVFARFIAGLVPGADGGRPGAPLMLACVLLSELEGRGHSCLMLDELAADPCTLMGWTPEQWSPLAASCAPLPKNVKGWIAVLGGAGQVWQAGEFGFDQPLVLDGERLYLRRYWRDETVVAAAIGARARGRKAVDEGQVAGWLARLFDADGYRREAAAEPDWQRLACAIAVRGDVAIITGGPGTGKTYTVARLLALMLALASDREDGDGVLRIALAAPTGKAAARLKQSIDKALQELAARLGSGAGFDLKARTDRIGPARTLHSLLGARPDTRLFAHHRANPLDVDILIVDEASMVHLEMMAALLDALPPHATLVLLGDKDQLSSVEAGAVLGDLCEHAEDGGYDGGSADYALAAAGQPLPPRYRGEAGAPQPPLRRPDRTAGAGGQPRRRRRRRAGVTQRQRQRGLARTRPAGAAAATGGRRLSWLPGTARWRSLAGTARLRAIQAAVRRARRRMGRVRPEWRHRTAPGDGGPDPQKRRVVCGPAGDGHP